MSATYAKRHDTSPEPVALHRVQYPRGQHRAGGPDGMTVRNCTTLDVDDVFRPSELTQNGERHHRERFVDLDPLDITQVPASASQHMLHRRYRADAEQSGFDCRNPVGGKTIRRGVARLTTSGAGHTLLLIRKSAEAALSANPEVRS